MPEPEITTCATPGCGNTWQAGFAAGPQPELRGLCEIEAIADAQPPGPEEAEAEPEEAMATVGKFEQTGPAQVHIHPEGETRSVSVRITRPGQTVEPGTGKRYAVRQSFRIGSLRRAGTGSEPGEELSECPRQGEKVRRPYGVAQPPGRAILNIDGIMVQAWRRSQEEPPPA